MKEVMPTIKKLLLHSGKVDELEYQASLLIETHGNLSHINSAIKELRLLCTQTPHDTLNFTPEFLNEVQELLENE